MLRLQNIELAEKRRQEREVAQQWSAAMAGDSDEEKEKRPRKGPKKQRVENVSVAVSGDEGAGTSEPKKKRKGKLRKEGPVASGGEVTEEEALFSGEEMEDRPKKVSHPYYHRVSRRILIFCVQRPQKKRVVRDEDEEEGAAATQPRKKQL